MSSPRENPGSPANYDLDRLDQICWSCRTSIDQRNGISLLRCDGTGSLQVCETCWSQIPIADRIKLQWLFRPSRDEGAGIVDAVAAVRDLFRLMERRAHAEGETLGGNGSDDQGSGEHGSGHDWLGDNELDDGL